MCQAAYVARLRNSVAVNGTLQCYGYRMKWFESPKILALAVCLLSQPPVAMASLLRAMDLVELTAGADQIVVGDVVSVQATWDASHRSIYSTIEVNVQESWKGSPPANGRISIRQPGGKVGEIEMTVHGMPSFSAGERTLLFLKRAQVVGMGQGKRRLYREPGSQRWLAQPRKASTEVVVIGSKGHLAAAADDQPEMLDSLREQVRALVAR